MDKDTCITNLRDLIKPSNTDDENEALLFAIESVRDHGNGNWKFYYDHGYEQAKRDLKKPQGEWEEPFESHGKTFHKCNHCHLSSLVTLFDNFCPNCGAEMENGGKT